MQWIPTNLPNSSLGLIRSASACIRRALSFLFLSAFFWGSSSSVLADTLSVDSLSEEEFDQYAQLAFGLRALATSPSSGNITNDVAAILDLLNNAVLSNGRIITVPYTTGSLALQNYLFGLGENWTASSAARTSSFLYEIQRALYGQQGVPSQSEAIQPILLRILASMSGSSSGIDTSWTNLLSSIYDSANDIYSTSYDINSQLSGHLTYLTQLTELGYLNPIFTNQVAFADWLSQYRYADGLWNSHLDDSQFQYFADLISSGTATITNSISGPQDTWEDIREALDEINAFASKIHWDDFAYESYGGDRSVALDLGYWNATDQSRSVAVDLLNLQQNLFSSNDLSAVQEVTNRISSTESSGISNLVAQVDDAVDTMDSSITEDPEFADAESTITNPYNPIGQLIRSKQSAFDGAMPDFDSLRSEEVMEIFDGHSGISALDAVGAIRVNFREELQGVANVLGPICQWTWNILCSVLTAILLMRCLKEIAGSI